MWFTPFLKNIGDFPSDPVVRDSAATVGGMGSIPGWGTKIPHAAQHGQEIKK